MTSPISFCSSEFDAAEIFADALMNQISREDVRNMVQTQRDMLSRFEKTNEMLINFNILSANRCAATGQEFKKHTQLLFEMKKDLDTVFKRIRIIKERLGKVYPEAFKTCGSVTPLLEEEEGEEESVTSSKSSQSISESQSSRINQSETDSQSTDSGQTVSSQQTVSVTETESDKVLQDKTEYQPTQASKVSQPDTGTEASSQTVARNIKTKSNHTKSSR